MNKNFEMKILATIHSKMKRSQVRSYSYTRLTFRLLWTKCIWVYFRYLSFFFHFWFQTKMSAIHYSWIHADVIKMILNNHETKLQFTEHSTLLFYWNEDGSIRTYLERSIARKLNQPHFITYHLKKETLFVCFLARSIQICTYTYIFDERQLQTVSSNLHENENHFFRFLSKKNYS